MSEKHPSGKHQIGTHISAEGGISNAPLEGERYGCLAIQVFTKSNMRWLAKDLERKEIDLFKENLGKTKIEVVFSHAGYLINLASPDEVNHKKSIESMAQELQRAGELGIPFVVLHPGAHKGSGIEAGIKKVAESMNRLFDDSKKSKVKIALEITAGQGSYLGRSFEELAQIYSLIEDRSRIGFCFDTCHAFSSGYDQRDEGSFKRTWKKFDEILGIKNLLAVHINDSVFDFDLHKDRHEHIGEGKLGLFPFWRLLHDERFLNIPLVLETPKEMRGKEDMDDVNLNLLRRLEGLSKCPTVE